MKRTLVGVMTLALGGMVGLAKSQGRDQSLTVYVNAGANPPGTTLLLAKSVACEIFAKAGVGIAWKAGRPEKEIARQTIVVDIRSDLPKNVHPGALAYAHEFEGVHISVFYDRVENSATRSIVPKLLGHVLAHEITHILEGVNHHSAEGLMKAHWSSEDITGMAHKSLPFDPDDLLLIALGMERKAGMAPRNANLAAQAVPAP